MDEAMKRIKLPPPVGLCPTCVKDERNTFLHHSGKVIVSWCDHNHAAGILQLATDTPSWTIYSPAPFTRDRWFEMVADASVEADALSMKRSH